MPVVGKWEKVTIITSSEEAWPKGNIQVAKATKIIRLKTTFVTLKHNMFHNKTMPIPFKLKVSFCVLHLKYEDSPVHMHHIVLVWFWPLHLQSSYYLVENGTQIQNKCVNLTDHMRCLEYESQPVTANNFCYKIHQQLMMKHNFSYSEKK